jgi:hypothetical protein
VRCGRCQALGVLGVQRCDADFGKLAYAWHERQVAGQADMLIAVEHRDELDGDGLAGAPGWHTSQKACIWHDDLVSGWSGRLAARQGDELGRQRLEECIGVEQTLHVSFAEQ